MVDLMPVTGLLGTTQLEVEAEHTALLVWGLSRCCRHNRTRSKFWGGHAARSIQMSIHAAARMSDRSGYQVRQAR
jgi:hypothetical protein